MAFNFNWSPLTADAGFYERTQELLTDALNKSPKPPIIVDDILVNELSLGHVPPELDILEIGDLADDRFRGIFKMSYKGDAFLTLKTRVQANPLNTYLSTRPIFASPQPLAAATGLTIPLQITLSDIRLSAFIVLVFSRQKGITLVFRNDPLESLKVSSTFDSIPFVRDHLQREIEGQLRMLLMDELPAIIHRLSLRLWGPEQRAREARSVLASNITEDEPLVDPLASPPHNPVDSLGNPLSPAEIASLQFDSSVESQSLFSQKSLLRLATLTDSHRTLSLFTPGIRDVVFRAWAGHLERGELTGVQSPSGGPSLSRSHSYAASVSTTYSFTDNNFHPRPALLSTGSSTYGLSMGGSRYGKGHGGRKKKKRVVNLRRKVESQESELVGEDGISWGDSASVTESSSSAPSAFYPPPATAAVDLQGYIDPVTPPRSPNATMRRRNVPDRPPLPILVQSNEDLRHEPPRLYQGVTSEAEAHRHSLRGMGEYNGSRLLGGQLHHADLDETPRASMYLPESHNGACSQDVIDSAVHKHEASDPGPSAVSPFASRLPLPNLLDLIADSANGGSIAEQAWMVKMAGEIARRYQEEEKVSGNLGNSDFDAPPAYVG